MSSEVVWITGAGSGMGLETALVLAAAGYQVFGSVRNDAEADALRTAAAARRATVSILLADVTDPEQVRAAVAEVLAAAGRVDALVYFAGLGLRGFVEDLEIDEIRRVFEVNFYGAVHCIQAVLPAMRGRNYGRMVLTTSVGGRIGSMSIGGYASSKFALEGLAECLAQEVAPFGIHVSLLEPGLIHTPHFTVHRNRARRAMDPSSIYYRWFLQHEQMVDNLLARNRFTVGDVARTVVRILAVRQPKLRYLVGFKAKAIVALRRYLPGEAFQRCYWGIVRRMVTRPKKQATTFSGLPKT